MSAIAINPDFSLEELLRLVQGDDWRVFFSPGYVAPGGRQGATLIGRTVDWSGVMKSDNETYDEYVERMEDINSDVAQGLRDLKALRKRAGENGGLSGETGAALLRKNSGQLRAVSRPAALLTEEAGKGEIISEHPTLIDAIDARAQRTGEQPQLPNVY